MPSKVRICSLKDKIPELVVTGVDMREGEPDASEDVTWFKIVEEARRLSSV